MISAVYARREEHACRSLRGMFACVIIIVRLLLMGLTATTKTLQLWMLKDAIVDDLASLIYWFHRVKIKGS